MTNPISILQNTTINGVDAHLGRMLSRYVTGSFYMVGSVGTTTAMVNNRAWAIPFILPRFGTLSGLGVLIDAAFATTAGNIRAGLFTDDGAMRPGARTVADYGTIAATAGSKIWNTSTALSPNIYWAVFTIQGASGTAGTWRPDGDSNFLVGDPAGSPTFTTPWNAFYTDTGFTGAYPSTFGTPAGAGQGPRIAVRFSA